ncbi:hypothetical protein EIK77_009612 [Talaromyces pinophilus]|nr:hypothetical protein EIK77_009612 [Talaromyces pinophilus]
MHFQRHTVRPIRVASVCPWFKAPARVHECNWVRHVVGTKHVSEDGHDLIPGFIVGLSFDAVRLIVHHGYEDDAGTFEEAWCVEGLEDWIVSALNRIGVEEVLCVFGPEDFVRRELEEDFGICAHVEVVDSVLFPFGEFGLEADGFVLKDAESIELVPVIHTRGALDSRESAYSVFRLVAASFAIGNSHTRITISDVGDGSVETQAFIVVC